MNLSIADQIILTFLFVIVVSILLLWRKISNRYNNGQSILPALDTDGSLLSQSMYDSLTNNKFPMNPLQHMSFKDSLDLEKYYDAFINASKSTLSCF